MQNLRKESEKRNRRKNFAKDVERVLGDIEGFLDAILEVKA